MSTHLYAKLSLNDLLILSLLRFALLLACYLRCCWFTVWFAVVGFVLAICAGMLEDAPFLMVPAVLLIMMAFPELTDKALGVTTPDRDNPFLKELCKAHASKLDLLGAGKLVATIMLFGYSSLKWSAVFGTPHH